MNYWSMCMLPLIEELTTHGWRVKFTPISYAYGFCEYKKKLISIDTKSSLRQQFLALCHEGGHRRAFLKSACQTERKFYGMYPVRRFREIQAVFYGWEYARAYNGRVSLRTWMREHKEILR